MQCLTHRMSSVDDMVIIIIGGSYSWSSLLLKAMLLLRTEASNTLHLHSWDWRERRKHHSLNNLHEDRHKNSKQGNVTGNTKTQCPSLFSLVLFLEKYFALFPHCFQSSPYRSPLLTLAQWVISPSQDLDYCIKYHSTENSFVPHFFHSVPSSHEQRCMYLSCP